MKLHYHVLKLLTSKELFISSLISCIVFLVFYFKLIFFFHGYIGFGNFLTPLKYNSPQWAIFFNPYNYDSIVISTPETSFFSIIIEEFFPWLLTFFISSFAVSKLLIIISSVVLFQSSYILSGKITNKIIYKLTGSLFFVLNPFTIMIMSQGDVLGLWAMSFVLLSLSFLLQALKNNNNIFSFSWLLSILFLALSVVGYQSLILGTILYICVLLYYSIQETEKGKGYCFKLKRFFLYLSLFLILLIVLLLPDVYPLLATGLTSSYLYNPTLSDFIANSVSPLNLLFLKGYPPNVAWLSVLSFGNSFFFIWTVLEGALCLGLLIWPFILKNLRGSIMSVSIVFFSFLGAGSDSFLFPISSYLFIHLPGFEALNASYFWEWILITLYLLLLLEFISIMTSLDLLAKPIIIFDPLISIAKKNKKQIRYVFLGLVLLILFSPVASQGYYGSYGINDVWGHTMPPSYSEIESEIKEITQNSTGGIAFFNPDQNLYFNNISVWFTNPFIDSPISRTAELSYYGAPHTEANRYFYWIYTLFYQNETRYLGALMGIAGIEYFVVLNGTNSWSYSGSFLPVSEGVNASLIMQFQYGVVKDYFGNGFTIYKNLNYTGTATLLSNMTVVCGGFSELAALPYFGFNITRTVPILSSDVNQTNYKNILSNVSDIVLQSDNNLIGLALSTIDKPIDSWVYANNANDNNNWTSNLIEPQSSNFLFDSVNPTSIAHGNASLKIPIGNILQGNYTIWFQLYHSSSENAPGGVFELQVGRLQKLYNTYHDSLDLSNVFLWENFSTHITPGESITIRSLSGWNAIRDIYIVSNETLNNSLNWLHQLINNKHIQITQAIPGNIMAPTNSANPSIPQAVVNYANSNFPYGDAAFISNVNQNTTIGVKTDLTNGTIYIWVIHFWFSGLLNLSLGNKSEYVGFDPNNNSSGRNSSSFRFAIPFNNLNGPINISLKTGYSQVYILGIEISPVHIMMKSNLQLSNKLYNLSGYSSDNGLINRGDIRTNVLIANSTLNINGSIYYRGPTVKYKYIGVVSLNYNFTYPYRYAASERFSITNGFYANVNSLLIGNTSGSLVYQGTGAYGSLYRSKDLVIDIYSMDQIPANTSVNISFNLLISFYTNSTILQPCFGFSFPKIVSLFYQTEGYSFEVSKGFEMIHLPYYSVMTAGDYEAERYSIDASVNQLVLTPIRMHSINVYVDFAPIVIFIVYGDLLILSSLIAIISYKYRKSTIK